VPTRAGSRSLKAIAQAFIEELQARHLSRHYVWQAKKVLPPFFAHLAGHGIKDVCAVSEEHLLSYARLLRTRTTNKGTPLASDSQANYLRGLRAFFAFLMKHGRILRNPAVNMPIPRKSRLPRTVLSETEARRLMSSPSPWTIMGRRDRAILETLYGTGLRGGECVRADLQDLDLQMRLLLVRNGKGRKDRMVPVPAQAVLALVDYLRESRPELVRRGDEVALFVSARGTRLQTPALRRIIRVRAQDVQIARAVFPHVLRHTYATHLLNGGADVRHVQKLLGHEHLETTALYTRVAIRDLQRVMARSHPREKKRRGGERRLRRRPRIQ
jgi:integrase/recombinase XerD